MEVELLKDFLISEKGALIARLQQFSEEHPLIQDLVENTQSSISGATLIWSVDDDIEEYVIGASTARGFSFCPDNGLSSVRDVASFLETHPGFIIEDEYGTEILLEKFKKICK